MDIRYYIRIAKRNSVEDISEATALLQTMLSDLDLKRDARGVLTSREDRLEYNKIEIALAELKEGKARLKKQRELRETRRDNKKLMKQADSKDIKLQAVQDTMKFVFQAGARAMQPPKKHYKTEQKEELENRAFTLQMNPEYNAAYAKQQQEEALKQQQAFMSLDVQVDPDLPRLDEDLQADQNAILGFPEDTPIAEREATIEVVNKIQSSNGNVTIEGLMQALKSGSYK